MSGPTIRRATLDDLDALAPLFDAYRAFYRQEPDSPGARQFLFDRLQRGQSVILLAQIDADIVGFAQLYPTFTSVRLASEWILNDLFVEPQHRRSGAGRALVEACTSHARDTGAVSLELLTEITNQPAQALYESLGWKRTTEYDRYTLSL